MICWSWRSGDRVTFKIKLKVKWGWTYAKLTLYINVIAEKAGFATLSTLTKTSIKTILDAAEIKLFHIQYYCGCRDPEFDAKMHDVLLVYKQIEMFFNEKGNLYIPTAEQDVYTISYDEKPSIQAFAATATNLPLITKNGVIMRDGEYKCLGTISLLTGIELLSGEAIPIK